MNDALYNLIQSVPVSELLETLTYALADRARLETAAKHWTEATILSDTSQFTADMHASLE